MQTARGLYPEENNAGTWLFSATGNNKQEEIACRTPFFHLFIMLPFSHHVHSILSPAEVYIADYSVKQWDWIASHVNTVPLYLARSLQDL